MRQKENIKTSLHQGNLQVFDDHVFDGKTLERLGQASLKDRSNKYLPLMHGGYTTMLVHRKLRRVGNRMHIKKISYAPQNQLGFDRVHPDRSCANCPRWNAVPGLIAHSPRVY